MSGEVVPGPEERRLLWLTGCLSAPERPGGGSDEEGSDQEEGEEEEQAEEGEESEESKEEEEEEEEEEEGESWREAWERTQREGLGGDDERQLTRPQVRAALEASAALLGEISEDGQLLAVASGGRGGRGNSTAPSKPYGPASRTRQDGGPGQRRVLLLETRVLADAVLVGLPNVGKSSLVAALTGARAQVGSYAFTTLRPQLGVLRFPDGGALTLADAPGLVEGAHAGRGRGAAFLAPLRKARVLALVIDLSGGSEGALVAAAPEEQLATLVAELARFDPDLAARPLLVAANKADRLEPAAAAEALERLKAATAAPIVPVSAARGAGLARLAAALRAIAGRAG
ncbi:MAG: P-loop containing nucleoside triphosphate hydrolase protein [Monoraphidium minutum]|nr:MAG: P-loop containing nucleoside triphosphate hydrolase protein [Monoraphidium minutum]